MHEPGGTRVKANGCVVAIEAASTPGGEALEYGSAIVVGRHHLLTCAHVVATQKGKGLLYAEIRIAGSDVVILREQCEVDTKRDVALLRTDAPLDAPCARWLDNDSLNRWLSEARPWLATGYNNTPMQLGHTYGISWLTKTDIDVQLHGGVPAGYSGGLLNSSKDGHQELAIGMFVVGGAMAATSRALLPDDLQHFLDGRQSAITLERVAWRPPPSGLIDDFREERARHMQRFGREDLLARMRMLMESDGWVILLGSWGVGKSAVMHYLLQEMEQDGPVPHHFIRRGKNKWDQPSRVAEDLVNQVRWLFQEADETGPNAGLLALLQVVSSQVLVPQDRRLTLIVDGLDEIAWQQPGNPLSDCLPSSLPPRVTFVVSSRPVDPHLTIFNDEPCTWLELDKEEGLKDSSRDACRQYLLALGESDDVARRMSKAAEGKFLICQTMIEVLGEGRSGLSVEQRLAAAQGGLRGLFERWWAQRVTETKDSDLPDRLKAGLGYLCAAREALPRQLLKKLAGSDFRVDEFRAVMLPFLRPTTGGKDEAFAIDHDALRQFFVDLLDEPLADVTRRLADALCRWSDQRDGFERRYVLRYGLQHWRELGDWQRLEELALDATYLEAFSAEVGIDSLNAELNDALAALGAHASTALRTLGRYARVRGHVLRKHPEIWGQDFQVWCVVEKIDAHETLHRLGVPKLNLIGGSVHRDGPDVVLKGHSDMVTACAVTTEGACPIARGLDHPFATKLTTRERGS
jgi:hypothetical protein